MSAQAERRKKRNPVLALPAVEGLASLPPEARRALDDLLREVAVDAAARAEKSWRTKKGPMAAYWKAVAVYSKHIAAAVRASGPRARKPRAAPLLAGLGHNGGPP